MTYKFIESQDSNKIRKYYNLFIYAALIFLVYYLYKYDYVAFDNISIKYDFFIASLIFLFAGFLLTCIAWKELLAKHSIEINYKTAISSEGLSIFAKYIPGKLMVVLGRASYVSMKGFSLKKASFVSLKSQLILLWSGLIVGVIPLLFFKGLSEIKGLGVLAIMLLSFFLFSQAAHNVFLKLILIIFRKNIDAPLLEFKTVVSVIFIHIVRWLFISLAFYFLTKSIFDDFGLIHSFAFPFSATIGILAIIFPAGIGVREGVMTGYLTLTGVPLQMATTIAIVSRLWFVCGELFIFVLGLTTDRLANRKKPSTN